MGQSKWIYLFLFVVIINFFLVCYLTIQVQKEIQPKPTKNEETPKQIDSKFSIITYARNQAELDWYQKRYVELIADIPFNEQPFVYCYVCNSEILPKSDETKSKLLFLSSKTCNLHQIYIQALKSISSEFFTFLDPGFTISKDIVPYLTLNKLSGREKAVYMILTLESGLEDGKVVELDEDEGDMVNKMEKKILREYRFHRHFTSFKVQLLIFNLLKENSKRVDKKVDIGLVNPDHIPETYSFILKTLEFKDIIINHLEEMDKNYQNEKITISSRIRNRLNQELNKYHIHLLTEKAIIYHEIPKSRGVTLAIHFSLDRINTVKETLSRWKGKTSLVLNVDKKEDCILSEKFDRLFCHVNKNQPKADDSDKSFYYSGGIVGTSYPVNLLRNIALELVETDLVFLIDADFVPDSNIFDFMDDLESKQLNTIEYLTPTKSKPLNLYNFLKEKNVLIIPAFDLEKGEKLPQTKDELLNLVKLDKSSPVLSKSKFIEHHEAHKSVNYKKWYESKNFYEIQYKYPFEPVNNYHLIL